MKSILKNSIWGIISQAITLLFSIIVQKIFISNLGIEYQGLNAIMTSIVSVLSLAELGIGTTIIFALYKPLYENDTKQITVLIKFFRKIYICISISVFILGIVFIPFLKFILPDTIFDVSYVRNVYILFLFRTAVSYIFAEYSSLLFADQKNYIALKYKIWVNVGSQFAQLVVIIFLKNYLLQLGIMIIATFVSNILILKKAKNIYPFLKKKSLDKISKYDVKNIFKDIKELSISRIVDVLIFQTDNFFISIFVGEIAVGMYSNYTLIIQGVNSFINCINQGIQPSFTNLILEKKEEKKDVFHIVGTYFMIYLFLASCCCCCYILFFQEFVSIWLGSQYLLGKYLIWLLVATQYLLLIDQPMWMFCYCNGLFKEIKQTGLISATVNLIASYVFVKIMNVEGVVLGTILCYLVSNILHICIVYRRLEIKASDIKQYCKYFISGLMSTMFLGWGMVQLDKLLYQFVPYVLFRVVLKLVLGIGIPLLFNFILYGKTEYAQNAGAIIMSIKNNFFSVKEGQE